ncbi:MAG: pitrilysin family protein [Candidatus Uhrbacteria bacterium]|nr:pitrilysin family protein [Candidatus Uhrbacteria bacterium]
MKPISHKLKNGMQAILIPHTGTNSMTLMALTRVGSRYEHKSINGVSHFIEHLMFKGTKRRPNTLALTKELDRYGAEFNAFTSKDMTAYYIKIDATKTTLAIDLLSDMLMHSKFDPKEINRERGVIVEEINMYEDNPRMHIEDLLEGALFPGNTLGWNIAGPREVIRSVPRKDLVDYRDRYYIPSRMTVVVAGKLPAGTLALLQKTFGSIREPKKRQDQPFTKFLSPPKLLQPVAFQAKKTEQVQLGLAVHGLSYEDSRIPAINLLATILGGTMSSRLFIQVRERRGLCYSIHANHESYEDTGIFSILAGLKKTRVPDAIRVIWQEMMRMAQKPVGTDELQRAKDHLRGKLTLAFEDSSTQAGWYGKQWVFQKKLLTPEERLRHIDRVTTKDIQKIAKHLFRPERLAMGIIGPFNKPLNLKKLLRV